MQALQVHQGQSSFLHLDIQDFFGSVNRSRVTRCLTPYFGYGTARHIANDSTVQHPTERGKYILPYGFVQSPLLATMALAKSALGSCLQKISELSELRVSVYVDDIVVSGPDNASLQTQLKELTAAAERARFEFNPLKQEGPAESITAFNIELARTGLELRPDRLELFRKTLQESSSEHQKMGILGYVRSIDEAQADSLVI